MHAHMALDALSAQASCERLFSAQTTQAEDVFDINKLLAEKGTQ
jgi:hypothetical protein